MSAPPPTPPSLEGEKYYAPTNEEHLFISSHTGIEDKEELKQHILAVQAKAYAVAPYPCIRRFGFLKPMIQDNPAYEKVIELGKQNSDAILLDVGCCCAYFQLM